MIPYLVEHNRYLALIGIAVVVAVAVSFSHNKRAINIRQIINCLVLEFLIALALLKTGLGHRVMQALVIGVNKLYYCADQGIGFVFGNLADDGPWGIIFAVKVLPAIIFFSAMTALLFHAGIIQRTVNGLSWIMRPLLRTSGAETLCATANSFLGQTEAPLLIRHYLPELTTSELAVVMVSGMATISGAILVIYAGWGVPAQHLIASSLMAIPGSILIAKLLVPETQEPRTANGAQATFEHKTCNAFDALAVGTMEGLHIALAIGAMLISFVALLALFNYLLGYSMYQLNFVLAYFKLSWRLPELTLQMLFGYLFTPIAYLLGLTGNEATIGAQLIGTKVAVNELVAFGQLVHSTLSERTVAILTYALCGFSNFSCIGIQLGGIGPLAPNRRATMTQLGLYAVLGGTLANLLGACIAALLL